MTYEFNWDDCEPGKLNLDRTTRVQRTVSFTVSFEEGTPYDEAIKQLLEREWRTE